MYSALLNGRVDILNEVKRFVTEDMGVKIEDLSLDPKEVGKNVCGAKYGSLRSAPVDRVKEFGAFVANLFPNIYMFNFQLDI